MTYTITAVTNDTAKLLVSVTTTTDERIADLVQADLERRGYLVLRVTEVEQAARHRRLNA